jgi:osmoprotectant transport system ATP-binding protein
VANEDKLAIEFAGVSYAAGRKLVLDGLSLQIASGETMILLGPSGSGKTTALKLINRLLTPTAGEVRVDSRVTTEWDVIQLRRSIGYAIQEIGLFPHYTVEQNIALLPRLESWPRERVDARVRDLLSLVGLSAAEFAQRYPDELSGGQRQRVGLARALALDPPILLLDEPFGALDPTTRADLQSEFRRLARSLQRTSVFVTHDGQEALIVGDRIALLDAGRLHGVFTRAEFLASSDAAVRPYLTVLRTGREILGKATDSE